MLEDSVFDVELISVQLQCVGFDFEVECLWICNVFIEVIENCLFDVIFVDYVLLGFDGDVVFVLVCECVLQMFFIFVFGILIEELVVQVFMCGVCDYVVK